MDDGEADDCDDEPPLRSLAVHEHGTLAFWGLNTRTDVEDEHDGPDDGGNDTFFLVTALREGDDIIIPGSVITFEMASMRGQGS